jgi:hypothetical protein
VSFELRIGARFRHTSQIRNCFRHSDYCAVASSGWNDPD